MGRLRITPQAAPALAGKGATGFCNVQLKKVRETSLAEQEINNRSEFACLQKSVARMK